MGREKGVDLIRARAMEFAGIGLLLAGWDGSLVSVDRVASEVLDIGGRFPLDERAGLRLQDVLPDLARDEGLLGRIRSGEGIRKLDCSFRRADQKRRWIRLDVFTGPVDSAGVSLPGGALIQAAIQDITEEKRVERMLRRSQENLRLVIDGTDGALWELLFEETESGYEVRESNQIPVRAKAFIGFEDDEFPNSMDAWDARVVPEDLARRLQIGGEYREGKRPFYEAEYRIRHRDGSLRWIHGRGRIERDEDGHPVRWVCLDWDITDRKRAEEALRESEETARALLNAPTESAILAEVDGTIITLNETAAKRFGGRVEDFIGVPGLSLFPPDVAERRREGNEYVVRKGIPVRYQDFRMGCWYDIRVYPVFGDDGLVRRLAVFARDITEQKAADERIRSLAQQLISIQENERRSISSELHDRIAQELATLKIRIETLFDGEAAPGGEVRKRVGRMSMLLQQSVRSVRDLAHELRPTVLDHLGLVRAVSRYCEDFRERSGLDVDFSSAGIDESKLGPKTRINLYRIVQEGLNNAWKHAQAQRVHVKLVASSPTVILRVEDDGCGFEPSERLSSAVDEKRMGLQSMEARASSLNGSMEVRSARGAGTRIVVEVPLEEEER